MSSVVTKKNDELLILVSINKEKNIKKYMYSNTLVDLCFVAYTHCCRDKNIQYTGDCRYNIPDK